MSEKKQRDQPHKCQTDGCSTKTYYRHCARCSCQQQESKQQRRERYGCLSYSWDQAQDRQAQTWNEQQGRDPSDDTR
jgi:hypothetical protein